MRWELSEEQEMFRDALKDWLSDLAPAEAVGKWLDDGDAAIGRFEDRLVADGWFGVGSPESAGGEGGGLLELALTAERLGHAAVPSSAWLASVLAVPALAELPELSAAVLTEGQFAALAVAADRPVDEPAIVRPAAGGLTGRVDTVLGSPRTRWLVVPVATAEGSRLYLVDATAEGVRLSTRRLLDRGRSALDVELVRAHGRELSVDADAVLAQAALRAAVLVTADSLGAAERMLEYSVDYSKQRKQFGVPIGSFQAVKHTAASMLVAVEAARSISYYAAAAVEQATEGAVLYTAAAKAQVTEQAAEVADSALTMHGAIGYTWEHPLHRNYKRAKLNRVLFGTPQVWNERLAAALPLLPTG